MEPPAGTGAIRVCISASKRDLISEQVLSTAYSLAVCDTIDDPCTGLYVYCSSMARMQDNRNPRRGTLQSVVCFMVRIDADPCLKATL